MSERRKQVRETKENRKQENRKKKREREKGVNVKRKRKFSISHFDVIKQRKFLLDNIHLVHRIIFR